MDKFNPQKPVKIGVFTRVMMWMAGVDEETLRLCPTDDWDNVRAIGLLMMAVWVYQTALFSIVAHRLLAPEGELRPELIAASMFVATLVLLIDSYMVMRSGWHLHGLSELKRGGLDISGGMAVQVRNGVFLALRILLSLGLAQLTAIFSALILFHPDIAADLDSIYQQQNTALIAAATQRVDADIQRAASAVDSENARVAVLANQVAAMRQGAVDPGAGDPLIQQAENEVTQLAVDKAKRDAELAAAQTFAANELAGVKGDPGNSGRQGSGPVRAAAEEKVREATANDAAAAQALADAHTRLDDLHRQIVANAGDRTHAAQAQLPGLEDQLRAEAAQLAALRAHQMSLTEGRQLAINTAIDSAPNHVAREQGFIAQIISLRRIAQDPEIAAVILLIDAVSFSLELAAVLAKVISFAPTTFSALLARNAYMRVIEIIDTMEEELNGGRDVPDDAIDIVPPDMHSSSDGEDEDVAGGGQAVPGPGPFTFGANGGHDPNPPKRPRGRPRKNPLN